jgi:hypothetical protein
VWQRATGTRPAGDGKAGVGTHAVSVALPAGKYGRPFLWDVITYTKISNYNKIRPTNFFIPEFKISGRSLSLALAQTQDGAWLRVPASTAELQYVVIFIFSLLSLFFLK